MSHEHPYGPPSERFVFGEEISCVSYSLRVHKRILNRKKTKPNAHKIWKEREHFTRISGTCLTLSLELQIPICFGECNMKSTAQSKHLIDIIRMKSPNYDIRDSVKRSSYESQSLPLFTRSYSDQGTVPTL